MTNTTTPSNKELDALIANYQIRIYQRDMPHGFERAIMRAALEKWGSLATNEKDEPIAWAFWHPQHGWNFASAQDTIDACLEQTDIACKMEGKDIDQLLTSDWEVRPLYEKAQPQAAAQTDTEDSARLNWLETHSEVNIARVRYLGANKSVFEITPYGSDSYDGNTLREAIDAAARS